MIDEAISDAGASLKYYLDGELQIKIAKLIYCKPF